MPSPHRHSIPSGGTGTRSFFPSSIFRAAFRRQVRACLVFHDRDQFPAVRLEAVDMDKTFAQRIAAMNAMYRLPAHDAPEIPAEVADRLKKFKKTLADEVDEIDDIVAQAERGDSPLDLAVAIADLLGDVIVYCRSEALKYGIPLEAVLAIIMDSNESKLGADGNPIYDANGKFLKGPNYWKPEPRIRELLKGMMKGQP
jgi:hypothetical protein